MKNKRIIALCIGLFLTNLGFTQIRTVDNFLSGSDSVKVIFYDPIETLTEQSAGFAAKSDSEKSALLNTYLHDNALYLFKVKNIVTHEVTYLCVRGDATKLDSVDFYKIEVIKNVTTPDFNPNTIDYTNKITGVINDVNCQGSLFENMTEFSVNKAKKYIGAKVRYYGTVRRVQPYIEVKNSIINVLPGL